jgi:hypothetical protein
MDRQASRWCFAMRYSLPMKVPLDVEQATQLFADVKGRRTWSVPVVATLAFEPAAGP